MFGISMFYWILYLVGVFGSDLLDFNFDGDVDVDGGTDLDLDGGHHDGGSLLGGLMKFVYAAEVPVTVVGSVLTTSMWAISLLSNHYLNNTSAFIALLLIVPILVGAFLATKVILMPFVPLIKKAFDETSDVIHVIGQLCVVSSMEVTENHGQAEVPLKGSPLLLNVKARKGVTMKKGDEAVVFAREEDGTYIIAPFSGDGHQVGEVDV